MTVEDFETRRKGAMDVLGAVLFALFIAAPVAWHWFVR